MLQLLRRGAKIPQPRQMRFIFIVLRLFRLPDGEIFRPALHHVDTRQLGQRVSLLLHRFRQAVIGRALTHSRPLRLVGAGGHHQHHAGSESQRDRRAIGKVGNGCDAHRGSRSLKRGLNMTRQALAGEARPVSLFVRTDKL